MVEEITLNKAKKLLIRFKKNKPIKTLVELNELKQVIEELDSITFKIKEWRRIENEFRDKQE